MGPKPWIADVAVSRREVPIPVGSPATSPCVDIFGLRMLLFSSSLSLDLYIYISPYLFNLWMTRSMTMALTG